MFRNLCEKKIAMKRKVSELHDEHTDWLKRLSFYLDDIEVMKRRLEEVAAKYTGEKILKQVEHFQNQLMVNVEQIHLLKSEIEKHEHMLEHIMDRNLVETEDFTATDHTEHREKIEIFEKNLNDLRRELSRFLARVF